MGFWRIQIAESGHAASGVAFIVVSCNFLHFSLCLPLFGGRPDSKMPSRTETSRQSNMKIKEAELVQVLISLCDKKGSKPSDINRALPQFSRGSIKRALQRAVKAGVVQANTGALRFRLSSKAREKARERSLARAEKSKKKQAQAGNRRSRSRTGSKSTSKNRRLSKKRRKSKKGRKGRKRRKSKKGKKGKKGKRGRKGRSRGRKGKKGKKGGRKRGKSKKRGRGKKGTKKHRKPQAKDAQSDAPPSERTGSRWSRFFKWNSARNYVEI